RLAPLGMRVEHYARLGVGDEAVAKRGWDGRVRRGAQPFRDEMCGEWTDRAKLGEASTRFLNRGSLLRPHERRARRSPQRALFAPLAALRLEREELREVAVGERRVASRRGEVSCATTNHRASRGRPTA